MIHVTETVGSVPYNIKPPKVTVVVTWCYMNKTELN